MLLFNFITGASLLYRLPGININSTNTCTWCLFFVKGISTTAVWTVPAGSCLNYSSWSAHRPSFLSFSILAIAISSQHGFPFVCIFCLVLLLEQSSWRVGGSSWWPKRQPSASARPCQQRRAVMFAFTHIPLSVQSSDMLVAWLVVDHYLVHMRTSSLLPLHLQISLLPYRYPSYFIRYAHLTSWYVSTAIEL